MTRIALLSDHLISQIAAGEVVERPASVVKELIENSLDAGARRIEVELDAGGRQRILVRDDGSGMSTGDLELAFARHATSKIHRFEDLERVATLGFRGEALAAIAAVARVDARSAERPGEGQRLRIEGGERLVFEPAAHPRGTAIEIENLFFNVPVRRRFLKQAPAELRRAVEVLQGYALARPDVAFTLHHEGRELLRTDSVEDSSEGRRARIAQLFGASLAENLIEVASRDGAVSGFVGNSKTAGGRRLFVFVNRRLLRDRAVLGIFYRAVRDEWGSDRFPALFLFLDLPPDEVDVNVHPQKSEVRFRNPHRLGQVGAALRRALALARGHEEAPLRAYGSGALPPLAWEGLGGAREGDHEIAEPGGVLEVGDAGRYGGVTGYGSAIAQPRYERGTSPSAPSTLRTQLNRGGEERALRILGQYKGSLILLEGPDGLYLVDQHAAHERVLFERLRTGVDRDGAGGGASSQHLLEPLLLELSPAESGTLLDHAAVLESLGFSLNELGGGTVGVGAVPAALDRAAARELLLAVATASGYDEDASPEELRARVLHDWAASTACRGAVRIHRPLSGPEMERLISDLFAAEQPHACPHGRPTFLNLTDADLERRFGRRGNA